MRWARTTILLIFGLLAGYYFLFLRPAATAQARVRDMAAALQPLKFLTVAPRAKHTATVIFVHVSTLWCYVSFTPYAWASSFPVQVMLY